MPGDGETTQVPPGGASTADRELAARLVSGESEALAEAYRHFAGLVFGLCQRVLNDDRLAEDVTQEVFVFLWQCPERFDPSRGTLRSWLAMLAHRRSVDRIRADTRRTRREGQSDPFPAATGEVDDHLTAGWLSDRVRDALGKLPLEQRQAVVLAYYGGRSYREVALELAVPEGTVKSRIRMALGKLNELLRADYLAQDAPAWT